MCDTSVSKVNARKRKRERKRVTIYVESVGNYRMRTPSSARNIRELTEGPYRLSNRCSAKREISIQ